MKRSERSGSYTPFQHLPENDQRQMLSALGNVTKVLGRIHSDGIDGDSAIQSFEHQFYRTKNPSPAFLAKQQHRVDTAQPAVYEPPSSQLVHVTDTSSNSVPSDALALNELETQLQKSPGQDARQQGLLQLLNRNVSSVDHPTGLYSSLKTSSTRTKAVPDPQHRTSLQKRAQPVHQRKKWLAKHQRHLPPMMSQSTSKHSPKKEIATKLEGMYNDLDRIGEKTSDLEARQNSSSVRKGHKLGLGKHRMIKSASVPTIKTVSVIEQTQDLYGQLRKSNLLEPKKTGIELFTDQQSASSQALSRTYTSSASPVSVLTKTANADKNQSSEGSPLQLPSEQKWRHQVQSKLESSLSHTQEAEKQLVTDIDSKIQYCVKELIPLDFMFERQLYGFCQDRGMDVMMKSFARFINRFWSQAIAQWKEFVVLDRQRQRLRAALVCQSCVRIYLSRCRIFHRRQAKISRKRKAAADRRKRIADRLKYAIALQSAVRAFQAVKAAAEVRQRQESATRLQLMFRRYHAGIMFGLRRKNCLREEKAAIQIQKVLRGRWGRQIAERRKKIMQARQVFNHVGDRMNIVLDSFRDHGAAEVMQRFWRNIPSKIIRDLKRCTACTTIQCLVRCHQARARVQYMKRQTADYAAQTQAACQIQSIFRMKKAKRLAFEEKERQRKADLEERKQKFFAHQEKLKAEMQENVTKLEKKGRRYENLADNFGGETNFMGRIIHHRANKYTKQAEEEHQHVVDGLLDKFELSDNKAEREKQLHKIILVQSRWRGVMGRKAAAKKRARKSELEKLKRAKRRAEGIASDEEDEDSGDPAAIKHKKLHKVRREKMALLIQCAIRVRQACGRATYLRLSSRVALICQRYCRGWQGRAFVKRLRIEHAAAQTIQTFLRVPLAQKLIRSLVVRLQVLGELHVVGKAHTQIVLRQIMDHMLVNDTRKCGDSFKAVPGDNYKGEVRAAFEYFCNMGGAKRVPQMGSSTFVKFCKECPRMMNKKMNQAKLELMFAKVAKGKKQIAFKKFMLLLNELAQFHLPKTQQYRRYSGNDAKLLRLICDFVLRGSFMKKAMSPLGKDNKCKERSVAYLTKLAQKIQSSYRGHVGAALYETTKQARIIQRELNRKTAAAVVIQRFVRQKLARMKFIRMLRLSYKKFIDPESQLPYWVNPKTGTTTWSKPLIFGDDDVEQVVHLPPYDEQYVYYCDNCAERVVAVWMPHTDEKICEMCDNQYYSKGKKAHVERVVVDVCIECAFQVATKRCDLTQDPFCDTCYANTHKRGVYKKATWTALVDMCANECNRAAQWKCDYDGYSYCQPCFRETFQEDLSVTYTDLPLHTESMRAWEKIQEDREKERKMKEELARKRLEWEQRRKAHSQTHIARTWRGAYVRKYAGRRVIDLLKAELVLRKKDAKTRKKTLYKVKDQFGKADLLVTDSNTQIVLKSATWWNRNHVRQGLNNHIKENMQQDASRQLETYKAAVIENKMNDMTDGRYLLSKSKNSTAVDKPLKLKTHDLVDVKNVKMMVKTADEGGWLVTEKNNKGSVKKGSKSILVKQSLQDKLKRGDRILLKSKGNPNRIHFVSRVGKFDEHNIPLDHVWRYNDNDNVRIYRFPVQAPYRNFRLTMGRAINNTFWYQSYLRSLIKVQASVSRKLNGFGNLFDDDMFLARGALGLMTTIDRHKEHNKKFTHKVMTERDEKIRLGLLYGLNLLAMGTMRLGKGAAKKLKDGKKKKKKKGDKADDDE